MSNRKLPIVATVRLAYAAARAQVATLGQIAARWGIAAGLIQAGFLSYAIIFFAGSSHALAHAQSEAQ